MPECQACVVGVPVINTGVGTVNEPMGACSKCAAFACGHHGHRSTTPRFLCIECDIALQGACAAWLAWRRTKGRGGSGSGGGGGGGPTTPPPPPTPPPPGAPPPSPLQTELQALASLGNIDPGPAGPSVTSLADWFDQRPDYDIMRDEVTTRAGEHLTRLDGLGADAGELWSALEPHERELLAGSLALIDALGLPAGRLPTALVSVASELGVAFAERLGEPMSVIFPAEGTGTHNQRAAALVE